jgi:plasmid stabilization system protein ParE
MRPDAPGGAGHAGGMSTPTKLQKARRAFLMRLVAEKGPDRAVEYLRQLADEIEQLAEDEGRAAEVNH